jgi:Phage endonuclease I
MPSPRRSRTRKEAEAQGYRSGFELRVAEQLTADGAEFNYEPKDEVISYVVHEVRKYLPDFVLPNKVIIECKGRLTAADRKKLTLIKAQHPDKDIRLVFMYDNKLNPRSKTRYSAWAEKNGFMWALKAVPEDWTK